MTTWVSTIPAIVVSRIMPKVQRGHLAGGAEADAAPAEVGAVAQADPAPEVEQDDGLHDDAERRGAGEHRDHRGVNSPAHRVAGRVGAEQQR